MLKIDKILRDAQFARKELEKLNLNCKGTYIAEIIYYEKNDKEINKREITSPFSNLNRIKINITNFTIEEANLLRDWLNLILDDDNKLKPWDELKKKK